MYLFCTMVLHNGPPHHIGLRTIGDYLVIYADLFLILFKKVKKVVQQLFDKTIDCDLCVL